MTSSSSTPPPIVPPMNDDQARALGGDEEEQPVDPDLNPDLVDSADADARRATEGELDGSDEQG